MDENCKPKRSKNRTDITDGSRSAEIKQNKTKKKEKETVDKTGRDKSYPLFSDLSHDCVVFF